MKNSLSVVLIVTMLVASGLIAFFAYGGQTSPAKKDTTRVLDVADKRLSIGESKAPLAIVEYADMLCPYCAKVNEEVFPQLRTDFIDAGKARYEIRLVATIAPDSQRAAEGAYCAAEQNKFWDYIDLGYKETWQNYYSQNKTPRDVPIFSNTMIDRFADRAGLDITTWRGCLDSGKYAKTIAQNQAKMNELNVSGTPYFIFNGQSYSGAPPYQFFRKVLEAEYNKKVQS